MKVDEGNVQLKKRLFEVCLQGQDRQSLPQSELFLAYRRVFSKQTALSFKRRSYKIVFYEKSRIRVNQIRRSFDRAMIHGVRFQSRILKSSEWQDKWKADYHITRVGKKVVIVPLWEARNWAYDKRYPIFLNPHSAFGSGMHETTRQMIQMMEPLEGKFDRCLDLGTGTGILAIAARRLGAFSVTGVDMDSASVREADENYRMNLCRSGTFRVANLRNLELNARFDLVLANLNSNTLVKYQKKIRRYVESGGYLLVAGVLKRGQRELMGAFRSPVFKRVQILRGRRWFSAAFRKK